MAPYGTTVRSTIVAYKERGRVELSPTLGGALARAVAAAVACTPCGPVLLVPVPTQRAGRRRRGFDPVLRLARVAAGELRAHGVPAQVIAPLCYAHSVGDQAGLGAFGRAANLAGALEVRHGCENLVRGRSVLPVDDVITTGATLAEAARALRQAGAEVPWAAVVAATQRRGSFAP